MGLVPILFSVETWNDAELVESNEDLKLVFTKPSGPEISSQQIYQDLYVSGLARGAFLVPNSVSANGKDIASGSLHNRLGNGAEGWRALLNFVPGETHLYGYSPFVAQSQSSFNPQSRISDLTGGKIEPVAIQGSLFRWIELENLPLRVGAKGKSRSFAFEILPYGERGQLRIEIRRPVLELSRETETQRHLHPGYHPGLRRISVILENAPLREAFLWGEREMHPKEFEFSQVESVVFGVERFCQRGWKILWPEAETQDEQFLKWAGEAKVRVFLQEYLGETQITRGN